MWTALTALLVLLMYLCGYVSVYICMYVYIDIYELFELFVKSSCDKIFVVSCLFFREMVCYQGFPFVSPSRENRGPIWYHKVILSSIYLFLHRLFNLIKHIQKQRHYFANKGLSSQGYGFSSGHVWM